jgi:CRP-like cAMP-binding protein
MLYSAVALTDVKLFKISVHDFQNRLPGEIHHLMEQKSLQKLEWIRQRLERVHLTRKKIADMDI